MCIFLIAHLLNITAFHIRLLLSQLLTLTGPCSVQGQWYTVDCTLTVLLTNTCTNDCWQKQKGLILFRLLKSLTFPSSASNMKWINVGDVWRLYLCPVILELLSSVVLLSSLREEIMQLEKQFSSWWWSLPISRDCRNNSHWYIYTCHLPNTCYRWNVKLWITYINIFSHFAFTGRNY